METNIECFELAKQYIIEKKSKYVVGLEFSGEPSTNRFDDYIEDIFKPAKELGIKISVHIAEIVGHHEETDKILEFKPDRIGHCCYMDEEELSLVSELKIPVEVCLSSNKATMNLQLINQNTNVKSLYEKGVTIIPCCDDTMLFNTNPLNETFELVNFLNLSELKLKTLMINAVDAIFDEDFKEKLRNDIQTILVKGEKLPESDSEEAKVIEEDSSIPEDS